MDLHPDIERIMEICDRLDETDRDQCDIKKYLTEHLLIKTCAEYEREIKRIVIERAGKSGDDGLKSFVSNTVRSYKHVAFENLQGNIVGRFSDYHKREFARRLEDGNAKGAYISVVALRNAVAHGERVSVTYEEFRINYDDASKVLKEFATVLGLQRSGV